MGYSVADKIRWPILFKNNSAETAPPFAVLPVTGEVTTGLEGEVALTIEKPSATERDTYVYNGRFAVTAGSYGRCSAGPTVAVLYTGSPAVGDSFGPTDGQWYATEGNSPAILTVTGIIDSGNAVMRAQVKPVLPSSTISYAALESSTDVAFSYTASAVTKIPFSVERVDYDSEANDSDDRLIAGTTGRYAMHFCGIARLASPVSDTAGPELFIRFRKNGAGSIVHSSVKLPSIGGVAVSQQVAAQWMLELDATDYMEVFAECSEDVEFARIFFHMWYLGPIP